MAAMAGIALLAGSQLASAYQQSKAMEAQARFAESTSRINAKFADFEAKRVIEKGDRESANYKKKVNQVVGSQRAVLAAQGLDPNAGTALDLQTETREIGAADALQIKNNAWLDAWGIKTKSIADTFQSNFASMSGRNNAEATLITGGMQAAGTGLKGYGEWTADSKPKRDSGGMSSYSGGKK